MNNEELRRLKRRKMLNSIMHGIFLACTLFGVVVLAVLMIDILRKGIPWLSFDFLKNFPSRFAKNLVYIQPC
ncbi:hypothetical protein PL321_09570 [Caloramator sp. mosi_1]|uniref:hypothetical protein n=1 Tax=Caloramator sp. mosi_1 TaxID=3023090 RepID=UPI00235E455E|nr:hypothetical protein [Caloramator sp. mosi_1]WDC85498.1 hypothetical protein PL321_09570 [Caloramator sp. mosi_1]